MVKCNNVCIFRRFLAFLTIAQLWNCKADKKHDRSQHKRVVSLKGVIRKKRHLFYVTSSIYCFCIWIFFVFTVFRSLKLWEFQVQKIQNAAILLQNFSYQLLIFEKRRKTSETLTLNSLNFIPNSSGVAVGKSRKG